MSIVDIEEELECGFLKSLNMTDRRLHRSTEQALFPVKGWQFHHEEFDLEVLAAMSVRSIRSASQAYGRRGMKKSERSAKDTKEGLKHSFRGCFAHRDSSRISFVPLPLPVL